MMDGGSDRHDHGDNEGSCQGGDNGHGQSEADRAEEEHFRDVVASFLQYRNMSESSVMQTAGCFAALPKRHVEMLGFDPVERTAKVRACIESNESLLGQIVMTTAPRFGNPSTVDALMRRRVSSNNADKARSILKLLVRDWAEEGAEERKACQDVL